MADWLGQQLGNYRITRLLGRGGFAEVYLGEHIYLNSQAALKVLRISLQNKDAQRFLAEAQTLVRLRHSHIVRLLEFSIEQGTPVLVMDYAPGGTIKQMYSPLSPLPLKVVVAYVKQVASVLQYAHNHKVIHRDVKPENILLGPEQELLLSDFGLSLLTPSPEQLSTQEVAGTIPYMAPELLHGKPVFASDQYALGIVTYEWLCGVRPFTGTLWEIGHQHLSVAPPPMHEKCPMLPVEVENVVLKALAKEPKLRFVSVQAFAHALARASQASIHEESTQVSIFVSEFSEASFVTQPDQSLRRVFLAASLADEDFATRLKADLEARGILVESTPSITDQEETVRQAIRAAQFVVVVVSPHMRSSHTIKEYLRIASMYERQLVFVWAAGDDIATLLPEGRGKTAMIDLVDAREGRYELALDELVARLKAAPHISISSPGIMQSSDAHATLNISTTEAIVGVNRTLILPSGQHVKVAVPAGAYDGQVIRLGNLVESSAPNVPKGDLVVTVVVTPRSESAVTETIPGAAPSRIKWRTVMLIGLAVVILLTGLASFGLNLFGRSGTNPTTGTSTANNNALTAQQATSSAAAASAATKATATAQSQATAAITINP